MPVSFMASAKSPPDIELLSEKGFLELDDLTVGDRISEMEKRGFPYLTEYGMDFCKRFAFDKVSEI